MASWKGYRDAARPLVGTVPVLLALAAVTLGVELGLAVYQYGILGNQVTRFRVVDGPDEIVLFFPAVVTAHLLLLALAYRLFSLLFRRRKPELLLFDFVVLFGTAFAISLAARTKLTAILGGALSLPLIRGLGGGDLLGALVYALDEAGFVLWIGAAATVAYVAGRLILRPGRGTADRSRGSGKSLHKAWGTALVVPVLLFAAAGNNDVRLALDRFAAPWLAYAVLETASDLDRDGYSLFSRHRDRHPFDPKRHPFALDVPGNGIDEDGLAGDYRHEAGGEFLPAPRFGAERRHVVLIALESTRAEMLRKRWNGRPVAPNLAALAAAGAYSEEAYSHIGFTTPALRTLLTGRLDPARPTPSLFSDFRRAGYRVAVLSSEAEDFGGIAGATGMRENAHLFIDARVLKNESLNPLTSDVTLLLDGRVLLREFDRHFGRRASWARPTFLYMNVQTSHYPYNFPGTPQILPGRPAPRHKIRFAHREWTRRTYWNSVAYGDWLIGQIVARLKRLGVLDEGVVLVVADHGEELFEHDYAGHGQRLNDLQTRIPFVLSRGDIAIPRPVGLADVRGLLLRAAGAEVPAPKPGRPVFQHTVELDRPDEIAMVEPGRRRTVLRLHTQEVVYEEADVPKLRASYRDLPPASPLRQKADRLVRMWERERWIRHLEQSGDGAY
ncbi:MAG TPA: sulfatase-like hydrolase/transferase [Allosphingosinicella sp.]|nr:sulfatase-like hydrolase/transferase [Allosphingosinicella sp.]